MDLPAAPFARNPAADAGLLSRHLLAHATATEGLAAWCEERGIGSGAIRTEALHRAKWCRGERAIGYRRVRLLRSTAFLSAAEIRFRCAALTPAMIRELEEATTPFGVVVARLGPRRITTLTRVTGNNLGEKDSGDSVLIHHATVVDQYGRPIARVREAYQRILVV